MARLLKKSKFNCPYCSSNTQQFLWKIRWDGKEIYDDRFINYPDAREDQHVSSGLSYPPKRSKNAAKLEKLTHPIRVGRCLACDQYTLWIYDKMYFPDIGNAPPPNSEMPENVKKTYLEAAAISAKSPRAAAALLRLCVQMLCKHLDEPGKNINQDIAALVKKGLPPKVQRSLDILRVTGNEAVHPGKIDTDDPEVVAKLFNLLNIIVRILIVEPREINEIYSSLPEEKRKQIEKRDNNSP